jgi:hypothetical protein
MNENKENGSCGIEITSAQETKLSCFPVALVDMLSTLLIHVSDSFEHEPPTFTSNRRRKRSDLAGTAGGYAPQNSSETLVVDSPLSGLSDRREPTETTNKKQRCVVPTQIVETTVEILKPKDMNRPATPIHSSLEKDSKCSTIPMPMLETALKPHHRNVTKPKNMFAFFILVSKYAVIYIADKPFISIDVCFTIRTSR